MTGVREEAGASPPGGGGPSRPADAALAERFEEHRRRLRAVAYRMLGSLDEADDAVQEAWVRCSAAGVAQVENLGGWLTTIVTRICLNVLRARAARPETLDGPDPVLSPAEGPTPEQEALLADSVGLALLVVLDTLGPAERVAFVLHDVFDVPFGEIAPMLGRTPEAARQLASRARHRVRAAGPHAPEGTVAAQRAVVDAFFAAARAGDLGALVEALDPGVVLRTDGFAAAPAVLRGAATVAGAVIASASPHAEFRPVLVNGAAGVLITLRGRPAALIAFTVAGGRITAVDSITDPHRVRRLLGSAFRGLGFGAMRIPADEEILALHEKHAPGPEALRLVYTHCQIVRGIAEQLYAVSGPGVDLALVRAGCLLHDIGVYRLYDGAGQLDHAHYIRHGLLGYQLLREEGLPEAVCRFASHHTGMGLTRQDVLSQGLPLPPGDYLAETGEEALVMYADKFHTKTTPPALLSAAAYAASVRRFGADKAAAFESMRALFGEPDLAPFARAYGQPVTGPSPA